MALQTIAISSPGDMGGGVGAALAGHGHDVITCVAGRSQATRTRAKRLGFRLAADLDSLLAEADIVLSITAARRSVRSAWAPWTPSGHCQAPRAVQTAQRITRKAAASGLRLIAAAVR